MKKRRLTVLFFILIILPFGCKEGGLSFSSEQKVFTLTDSDETGFSFTNEIIENEEHNVVKYGYFYNGAGVGVGDFNNDGLPDIFMVGNRSGHGLFMNKGDFKFENIIQSSNIALDSFIHGVTLADVNQDGYLDIYLTRSKAFKHQDRANQLYINNKDNTFTERAKEFLVDDVGFGTSATFFDYDNDGDLDLYVLNHDHRFDQAGKFLTKEQYRREMQTMSDYDYQFASKLYKNNGNGTFSYATEEAGILDIFFGLSASVSDINNDGYLDLMCTGDFMSKDHIYINNRNGTFTDRIDDYFSQITFNSMGSDMADIDNDGLLDVMTLDMAAEDHFRNIQFRVTKPYDVMHMAQEEGHHLQVMRNCLHINNGKGSFSEIGQLAGVSHTDWSWAPLFADYDNDGYKDLFISTGYRRDMTDRDYTKYTSGEIIRAAGGGDQVKGMDLVNSMTTSKVKNYIYKNNGNRTFDKKTDAWGLGKKSLSNGAAYADLDLDGDLDLIINNYDEPSMLYRNNTAENNPENNYLGFVFKPEQHGKVQGTKVTLFTDSGMQYQQLVNTRGFLSTMQQILHFGLGQNNKVQKVEIRYPNGTIQEMVSPEPNQHIVLDMTAGKKGSFEKRAEQEQTLTEVPNAFSPAYRHTESDFNDFKEEPLLEQMCSNKGPFMSKGDVNKDGLEDIYIGGSAGFPGQLYLQKAGSKFSQKLNTPFAKDRACEDGQSVFFDADSDGDLDLFVTSGSNEVRHDSLYVNRLYLNDGAGNFTKAAIPQIRSNTLAVKALDVDGDQDLDLVLGGNVMPKNFPISYASYVLINGGKGDFSLDINALPNTGNLGIVNDIAIMDVNADGKDDMITAGDWSPIQVFINKGGSFEDKTADYGMQHTNGLWNCLVIMDVDGDGQNDIVGGNRGLNNFLQCSDEKPAVLYYDDFDFNGQKEAVINYHYRDGILYPKYTLDEILQQMPNFRGMFPRYKDYSNATTKDIFSQSKFENMQTFKCKTFSSTAFLASGNEFIGHPLPLKAQYAPVYAIANIGTAENAQILTAGNNYSVDINIGKYAADYGAITTWDAARNMFIGSSAYLSIPGEKRDIKVLTTGDQRMLLLSRNNGTLSAYNLNNN